VPSFLARFFLGPTATDVVTVFGMSRSHDLRRKARRYRGVASHPTEGDRTADRELILLAERLEREADAADRIARANGEDTDP
jgi:hypothetical protein